MGTGSVGKFTLWAKNPAGKRSRNWRSGVSPQESRIIYTALSCFSAACVDQNQRCDYWAKHGECKKNPRYMLFKCPVSCKVCSGRVSRYGCRWKMQMAWAWKRVHTEHSIIIVQSDITDCAKDTKLIGVHANIWMQVHTNTKARSTTKTIMTRSHGITGVNSGQCKLRSKERCRALTPRYPSVLMIKD